ncbi:unnamed protein product, partial [Prunus brigantina]
LDKFKIYKAEVENQLNLKIKVVKSDREGEYYGRFDETGRNPGPFAKFLQEEGIIAHFEEITLNHDIPQNPSEEIVRLPQMDSINTQLEHTEETNVNGPETAEPMELNDNQAPPAENQDMAQAQEAGNPEPNLELRRSQRQRKPALRDDYFVYLQGAEHDVNTMEDPATFKQAMTSEKKENWFVAMKSELNSMEKNGVWKLVTLPQVLYVDDILLACTNLTMLHDCKSFLSKNFEMTDLAEASYVLGIDISRDRKNGVLGLSQKSYIEKVLKRFNMLNCTGSDIPIVKGDKLSTEQAPKTEQEKLEMLTFKRSDTLELQGYADANFAGCQDSLKSTSGFVFMFGGGAVSWRSVKQPLTAGSTMFAEFLACYEATSQAIWLRNFIISLNVVESIHRPIQI